MPHPQIYDIFARRLRELAEAKGLDVSDLAALSGMGRERLQSCLDGTAEVDLDEVALAAGALGVEPRILVR